MSQWDRRANEIFLDAVEQPEETRPQFLKAACSGDSGLRRLVESLLSAASKSKNFIETPVIERPGEALEFQWTPDPPLFEGKYRLDERVGSGGMGVVYSATQTAPIIRRVAIKLIRNTGADAARLARFEQERQALALMDHPNIAKIHDAGATTTGQPYLVMEFIAGPAITVYCDQARLSIDERLKLFVEVCRGLHHAHQKSVIHRDLKPSNVLVSDVGGVPTPKLIDFGVAKVLGPRIIDHTIQTGESTLVGTLEYMAPEQAGLSAAGGNDVDIRADVYSIGLILYELLTGLQAFDRDRLRNASIDEAVRMLRDDDPPSLSQRLLQHPDLEKAAADRRTDPKSLIATVTGDLDWITQRCLAKDRERRYASANDLADDVARYLSCLPIEARPASSLYRLGKFIRRRRGLAISAALVTLALVGGAVGTAIGFLRAENALVSEATERAKAELARDHALEALDAMTSAVTGESLTAQKEVTQEQKKFLQSALGSYRKLAEWTANDESSRKRSADAARRVGHIEELLGDYQRSLESYRTAVDSFASLAADFARNNDYRRHLGLSLGEAGMVCGRVALANDEEQLLLRAASTLNDLLQEDPTNPRFRSDAAISLRNLSVHYMRAGRWDEALNRLEPAKSLLEALVKEQPEIDLYRGTLAACLHGIGMVERRQKKLVDAERHSRRAIELRLSLSAEQRNTPGSQAALASYYAGLGRMLCDMNRVEDGIHELQAGLAIEQQLVSQFPSRPDYRSSAAGTMMHLAQYVVKIGDRNEERRLLGAAIESFERLTTDHPEAAEFKVGLAGACCNLGISLRIEKKLDEAIKHFDRAAALLEPQILGGKNENAARSLRICFSNRGQTKELAAQWRSAAEDFQRAAGIASAAEESGHRIDAAYCFAKDGDAKLAIAELERVGDRPSLTPFYSFHRARTHALLINLMPAKAAHYGDEAMAGLKSAARGGMKNMGQRLQDETLDPLRDREEFKRLMKEASQRKPNTTPSPKT